MRSSFFVADCLFRPFGSDLEMWPWVTDLRRGWPRIVNLAAVNLWSTMTVYIFRMPFTLDAFVSRQTQSAGSFVQYVRTWMGIQHWVESFPGPRKRRHGVWRKRDTQIPSFHTPCIYTRSGLDTICSITIIWGQDGDSKRYADVFRCYSRKCFLSRQSGYFGTRKPHSCAINAPEQERSFEATSHKTKMNTSVRTSGNSQG